MEKLPPAAIVAELQLIHRAHDGFVVFSKKTGDGQRGWREGVAAIRADKLATMFPEFVEELAEDSYFSINGFSAPPDGWTQGRGVRLDHRARYLTAAYADLDSYDLSFDEVLASLTRATDKGLIPPPSIISRSGRGTWVFYLLHREEGAGPVPADSHAVARYRHLQQVLHDTYKAVLPQFAPDPKARDIARVTRIPGSVHSGAGRRVKFHLLLTDWAKPVLYTLDELTNELGLPTPPPPQTFRPPKAKSTGTTPKRKNGLLARYEGIAYELQRISTKRGGIQDGQRNHAALTMAVLLRRLNYKKGEIRQKLTDFTRQFRPPLSTREVQGALRSSATMRMVPRNQTIAEWLGVEVCEADELGLQKLRPDYRQPLPKGRKAQAKARREAIAEIFEAKPLSIRGLRAALAKRGIDAAIATIRKDLAALDLQTPCQVQDAKREAERKAQKRLNFEAKSGSELVN